VRLLLVPDTPRIDVVAGKPPAASLDVLVKSAPLHFQILTIVDGGDSTVDRSSNWAGSHFWRGDQRNCGFIC
jgi:hypothetical protein